MQTDIVRVCEVLLLISSQVSRIFNLSCRRGEGLGDGRFGRRPMFVVWNLILSQC